jgi:ABC-type nitrate/sulfonate/bicarbonate transport system substrate-binding protein
MRKLQLALDWTPNVNHVGFFVARELGLYADQGIELELLSPLDDNYALTPGKKLELGMADFAIAPFETVISLNNKANPVPAVAIYAILQEDLSCIATLKSAAITSPKELDGKSYASYKARYEDHIVREVIKNDGGKGEVNIIYPEKLGIWNTLLSGNADSTWIFDNWEGIEAESKGIELHKFNLGAFDIPYGYSPVVFTNINKLKTYSTLFSDFIQASRSGFLYARNNPKNAGEILKPFVTEYDLNNVDLEKAISFSAPFFGDETNAGFMKPERVNDFVQWLVDRGLEHEKILRQELYTNELF